MIIDIDRNARGSLALMLVVPALAALLVYAPTLNGGFLSDDYSLLHTFFGADLREIAQRVAKMLVSGVGPPSNQYRPLTMASFALNVVFTDGNPAAWRLVNLLLHAGNSALVALLAWQLGDDAARGARSAAAAAGLAFAWFAPSVEAVAWIAARFDGMALFWILVSACCFMASRDRRDRYSIASLVAAVLAFMSKESATIGVALIVALAWVKRPAREGLVRSAVSAAVFALPWLVLGAAYFALRAWIFGDPFRFYPGTSPGLALLSGRWLLSLPAIGDWWPIALPEAGPRRAYTVAALLLLVAAASVASQDARARRVLSAVALATLAALALLLSHWTWSASGEGGRVLYTVAAVLALGVAVPLRAADRRLQRAAWVVAAVLLGSGWILTHAAVERRAQAGSEMKALVAALARLADATPAGSFSFVIVPDHLGAIPFARNGQGGMMLPPVQARSLSSQLVVQLADDLSHWPDLFARDIVGRMKREPLADVTANPARGATGSPTLPDRYFCWSTRSHSLVSLPLVFAPGLGDWEAVWKRALADAGCSA